MGTGALVLLAVDAAAWASSAVSHEDELAAEPATAPASSAGHKEDHHADCAAPPTLEQQEAADKLAADTRAGVAKYVDPSMAVDDGYQPSSPT